MLLLALEFFFRVAVLDDTQLVILFAKLLVLSFAFDVVVVVVAVVEDGPNDVEDVVAVGVIGVLGVAVVEAVEVDILVLSDDDDEAEDDEDEETVVVGVDGLGDVICWLCLLLFANAIPKNLMLMCLCLFMSPIDR